MSCVECSDSDESGGLDQLLCANMSTDASMKVLSASEQRSMNQLAMLGSSSECESDCNESAAQSVQTQAISNTGRV
eukprot:539154-Pleurochrysis_carterae.AAC.1